MKDSRNCSHWDSYSHLTRFLKKKQNQPLQDVLKNSCPATALKQLKKSVQEFISWVNIPAYSFFKDFYHIFRSAKSQRMILSNSHFTRTHLIVIFCVPCELKTSNLAAFFNFFIFSSSHDNKCGNILEQTYGTIYVA